MDDRTEEPGGDAPTVGYRLPAYVQPGPDWQALADQNAAGLRRQRWLKIAGVVLGTLCVAGLAVGAITLAGGGSRSSASGRQSPTPPAGSGRSGPPLRPHR